MGMAAGRAAAMVASAAAVLLLAGGAHADCYSDCFNDCMSKFKDMRDYCSYACDKVCTPDADATLQQRPPLTAVVGPAALADHHHHPLDKKQDVDAVWPAALPDHPLHETHGGGGGGEPDPGHVVRPARAPVLP